MNEEVLEQSHPEVVMAYPDLLADPDDNSRMEALSYQQDEIHKEYQWKCQEELCARGEGTSGSGGGALTFVESKNGAPKGSL